MKSNLYSIVFFVILFFFEMDTSAFCQKKNSEKLMTVTGRIVNSNTQIERVKVSILGKDIVTYTNSMGYFVLSCLRSSTIILSKSGYNDVVLTTSANMGDIQLSATLVNGGTEDVINLSYGEKTKRNITGFVSTIKTSSFAQIPLESVNNYLAGKIPGLYIQQTGTAPGNEISTMQIRGRSTYNTGNTPIAIVDGATRDFQDIDINEIESISILKDATSLGWYGLKGGNGVMIITTKRGSIQKMSLHLDAQTGFQMPINLIKPLNSYNYSVLYDSANSNDGTKLLYPQSTINGYLNDSDHYRFPNNNFKDTFYKPLALTQRYVLSVNGGNSKFKYFALMGFFNQDGLLNHTKTENYNSNVRFSRLNFRVNLDFEINPNLIASLDVGGRSENRTQPGSNNLGGVLNVINNTAPNAYALINPNGTYGGSSSFQSNPYALLMGNGVTNRLNQIMSSTMRLRQKLDYILEGFSANLLVTYDAEGNWQNGFQEQQSTRSLSGGGFGTVLPLTYRSSGYLTSFSRNEFWIGFDYNRVFKNKHKVDASFRFQRSQLNLPTNLPYRLEQFVGKVDYAYKNKYYATFVNSYSGSENFSPSKRYGFFPSIGIGWILTEEKFLKPTQLLNYVKIHSSYGKVGNDAIGTSRFPFNNYYSSSAGYAFGTGFSNSLGVAELNIANPNITWENIYQTNVGVEIMLLKKSFDIEVNYFSDTRKNILTNSILPDLLGQSAGLTNSGNVSSKGFEVSLSYNKKIGSVRLGIFGNYTLAINKIEYINEGTIPALQSQIGHVVGMPINFASRLMYLNDGLFRDSTQLAAGPKTTYILKLGDIRYKDMNGDGRIDAKDQVMTNYTDIPKSYFGFGFNIVYKKIDLSTQFQGAFGRTIDINTAVNSGPNNLSKFSYDSWTYSNAATALWPRLSIVSRPNNTLISDYYLRSGDYIKIKTAELGYSFPFKIKGRDNASSLRVYISGNNIYSWNNVSSFGIDPEFPNAGYDGNYPYLSTYTFGATFKF